MTLKEKLADAILLPFYNQGFYIDCDYKVDKCEKIADDYAIEFAKWIVKNCNHSKLKFLDYKELLETFKKEKGL